jgi:hypothetical protein
MVDLDSLMTYIIAASLILFYISTLPIYFIISKAEMILSWHFAVLFSFRALLNADMMFSGTALASWNTYVDIYSY